MLTDTHCHLDFDRFDGDRDQVLERAWAAGLTRILVPALDIPSCIRATDLAETDPRIFVAVGVHPNSATTWDSPSVDGHTLDALRRMAAHPKVVAIGEIGLDYYWDRAPRDLQHRVLRAQLGLAAKLKLPVVIHNRESSGDLVPMMVAWQAKLAAAGSPLAKRPGVLHSFSASAEDAEKVLDANFYIGVTGPVTFKNAPNLQSLISNLPPSRLLIETDGPFLSPHPYRGERNEPARVKLVAEKIATLQGVSFGDVARQTTENARRLFGW
ncbi:MAG: TatD family hydrolase [Anaerolineales bacterium]